MRKNMKIRKMTALSLAAVMLLMSGCQAKPGNSGKPDNLVKQENSESATEAEVQAGISKNTGTRTEQRDEGSSQTKTVDMEGAEAEQLSYGADDYEKWNQILQENEISEEFRKGLESFAYRSGSALLKEEKGNSVYSPLSLYYALALAGYGAEGETASQIFGELGMTDRERLAEECRKLYTWYACKDQHEKKLHEQYGEGTYNSHIRLANSLWVSGDLALNRSYQKTAAEKFFASSYGVNFKDAEAGERIGKWITEKTQGVLTPQISPDPDTLLALVNTLYFYGGWADRFQKEDTREDTFTLTDGGKVTVPFLNRIEEMGSFKRGDGYLVSSLNTNNSCEMVFLLPDKDRTAEEFLADPVRLMEAMDNDSQKYVNGEVVWKVPGFSFGSSFNLEQMLKDMGMKNMFEDSAEFGGISDQPLKISDAIQEAHIGIDEDGVEGAAYTMLAMEECAAAVSSERAEMILDRPFIFGIRDWKNGVWMFLGICRNPAESA